MDIGAVDAAARAAATMEVAAFEGLVRQDFMYSEEDFVKFWFADERLDFVWLCASQISFWMQCSCASNVFGVQKMIRPTTDQQQQVVYTQRHKYYV